ncbi:hypothetical protein ACQ4PT_059408 [Festuca glaucescens]
MEADARGSADHVATTAPPLKAEDGAAAMASASPLKVEDGAAAMAPAPQVCDELTDYSPPTEEDEEKPNLAVKLEQSSVEAISVPSEVKVQIGEEKGSRTDEMPMMNMDDEAVSVPFQVKVEIAEEKGSRTDERPMSTDDDNFLAESGDLNTCHAANSGLSSKARNAPCSETFYSRDVVCACGTEDRETGRSQDERDGLAGNGGDWGGMAEVMTAKGGLKAVSEGLSDSAKHDTERWPRGVEVDGAVFMTDDSHELQQGDSMPKIEPEVSGSLHEDSVPSVSGRIDVSLIGNGDQADETYGDPVACHVADGGLSNKILCAPSVGVSQPKYSAGCVYDMVAKAPEASQCEEAGLAGDGALLKASLDDLQTRCKEPHCYAVGFSNSVKFDIQQLPHHMEAMLLKKDVNHELETDGLLPKIEAKVSSPAHEDSVPTTFGRNLAVYLDGKDGEISEHKTGMAKLASGSLGGGMLSGENGFWKEAPGDENKFSTMEGCYVNRGLGHQGFSGIELGCPDHLALELNACNSVADKPCSTVFAENGNDEELENQNSESLSVSRRRNPRRSASSRNPTLEKHDQICKGSNNSRKSNKVESSCSLVESTIIKFPKKITKVRSGINRPLKSTAWGSLQKLTGGFGLNSEPSTSNSHPISLENGRSHKRSGKKEQPSVRNSRSSTCAKNKFPPFSAMGFASDELNGQPTFSVTTGTYASSEGYIGNLPRLDLRALVNGSDDAHKTAQCMSIQTDLQQLDRTCKDNQDKTFAGCSIPQEKTNAEINAELDLSDASADEADNDGSNSKASRAPSWTHARTNSFLHRNRRNQSIDEVLDITAYEYRQRDYASKGQKHFYFMALNGGEGEELTFDYNYVRVSGAAPQKCFCGTAECRGYIGGDISGSGIISQDDAEAEHFQPLVTYKDAEEMLGNAYYHVADPNIVEHETSIQREDSKDAEEMLGNAYSHVADPNIVEHETSIQREDSNNCPPATPDSEPHQQTSPILSDTSEPENSMEAWSPQDTEEVTRTPVHVSRTIESSLQFPVYVTQPLEFLEKTPNPIDGLTAPNVMNRSTPSSDMGGSLVPGFHAKKENSLKHHRNVKLPCPIDSEHTLGVEVRLNSLLDRDGGISRRKDSTNEYLRLLLVTAADGEAGGTSKSIRDLALILDALLQTKSGAVLLDIINMNGLQMLHNILKQNRDHFLRRPIIRKLLKVHPIARKFCDKWILPYMDGPANCSTHSYSARRKRKSRWDYQPESHYKMVGLQTGKVYSGHRELDLQTSLIGNVSQGNWVTNSNHNDVPVMGSSTDGAVDDVPPGFGADDDAPPGFGADDDAPPGFEPQQEHQPAQAPLDLGGAPGFCQERYLPNSSPSSEIPVALVQHFGTPEVEGTQGDQKWKDDSPYSYFIGLNRDNGTYIFSFKST